VNVAKPCHFILIHRAFCTPRQCGGTRHYELLAAAAESGYRSTVITSDVNYQTGTRSFDHSAFDDTVFTEQSSYPQVIVVPIRPKLHNGFWQRILCFVSFCVGAYRHGDYICDPLTYNRNRTPIQDIYPVDFILGTSPDLFQAFAAWRLASRWGIPFVLEIRDLWPEFAVKMGVLRNPVLIALSRWLSRLLLRNASKVIVNSPAYISAVVAEGVLPEKIVQIDNGVDTALYSPERDGDEIRKRYHLANDDFVVVYAGALGLANDLTTLLHAAKKLEFDASLQFLIAGDGQVRTALEQEAVVLDLKQVQFLGSLSREEMPDLLAAADVCVATLLPVFDSTYPNKVFDAMAAGRPLVLAMNGPVREIVESEECGIYVPPSDVEALADAISQLKTDACLRGRMGQNARRVACQRFDRKTQAKLFVQALDSIVQLNTPAVQRTDMADEIPVLRWRPVHFSYRMMKRLFDVVVSFLLIVLTLPMMIAVAVAVRLGMGAPVFFCQTRAGLHEVPFQLIKFRTLKNWYDENGGLLPDDKRQTRLGRFLRQTSLDELPELFLVLGGKMSLVGPRPLPVAYLGRYLLQQRLRHSVMPGLTGLAQVLGRNSTTWSQRFRYDIVYARRQSFLFDLRILFRTPLVVLKGIIGGGGIAADSHSTMPEFTGGDEIEVSPGSND